MESDSTRAKTLFPYEAKTAIILSLHPNPSPWAPVTSSWVPATSPCAPACRQVLGFELSTIGVLLAVPGALRPVLLVCAALLADKLVRRADVGRVRKGFTVAAFVPQALPY